MSKTKVYIAGPMTGKKEYNFPEFFKAEEYLKTKFDIVFNPARHDQEEYGFNTENMAGTEIPTTFTRRDCFAWDMARVCESDAIYMLRGWERSRGARAEHALAIALNETLDFETVKILYQE